MSYQFDFLDRRDFRILPPGTDDDDYSWIHWWRGNSENTLEALFKEEELIVRITSEFLEDALYLVQDAHTIYGSMIRALSKSGFPGNRSSGRAGGQCAMECRRLLVVGAQALLRGHLTDSAMYQRRALECCIFAISSWRSEQSAEAWLKISKSRTAARRYRRHFPIMSILTKVAETLPIGPALKSLYEWLSDQVHPSYWSVFLAGREDEGEFHLSYFDAEDRPGALAFAYFTLIRTHLTILSAFAQYVHKENQQSVSDEWYALVNGFADEYLIQKENWTTVIRSEVKTRPAPTKRGEIELVDRIVQHLEKVRE